MIRDFLEEHGDYSADKKFSELTTLRMGGEIAHYIEPVNKDDLKEIVEYVKDMRIPFKVIGNGSNIVAGSSKYEGIVISLKHFDNYEIENDSVYVEAGVMAPYLANVLMKEGLSGFEFASGIPGTVGGLVYMNAGAYKKEMADVVQEVLVLRDNELVWLKNNELSFSYRNSIFHSHPHWVVVATRLNLKKGCSKEIRSLMEERLERRKKTQPLDKPSAGSVFKNPEGSYSWKYIDELGLRGYQLNGVQVSPKHPNFIVNAGGGTGEDFLKIAYEIQEKTLEKFNVSLSMEVEKFNC